MRDHSIPVGVVRKLWPAEAGRFREHLLRLDHESRASRFGSPVTNYFIRQYAARALDGGALVHGYFVDGELRGCAELRGFGARTPQHAEVACSIEKPFQNNGVGSLLMSRTILAARNRGIRKLHLNCLPHNHSMQAIARKFTADLHFEANDVAAEITNPYPDPLSLFREFVADGCSIANTILDMQNRMLRAA